MNRRNQKVARPVKYLIRRGPWRCSVCDHWIRDEKAPLDQLSIKEGDICRSCKKRKK